MSGTHPLCRGAGGMGRTAARAEQQPRDRAGAAHRHVLLVVLLLVAFAAGEAKSGSGPPRYNRRLMDDYSIGPMPRLAPSSAGCPGVAADGACGPRCQLTVCQALVTFYRVTNNASDPWDEETGWTETQGATCQQLLARTAAADTAAAAPPYCGWFGVICCDAKRLAARRCRGLHSVSALALPINNLNASLANPRLFGAVRALHDCGLTGLDLESNNLIDGFTDAWSTLRHLQVLNLGCNWLNGTMPNGMRRLTNITFLNLSNNWLRGTLPTWLQELTQLRVLTLGSQAGGNEGTARMGLMGTIPSQLGAKLPLLRQLSVDGNSLSGTLPPGLCDGEELIVLNVRNNLLTGSAAEVEQCANLEQLDISSNHFSGSLPASKKWQKLVSYSANNNRLSGRFPKELGRAHMLETLDLGFNELTGLIPAQITLINSLKSVVISNNRLSGTVVEDLFFMPSLAVLDLSYNELVGTTPTAIGQTLSLAELDVSNNLGLTGVVPPQVGQLTKLNVFKALNTSMSCAGVTKAYVVTTNNSCTDPAVCLTPVEEPVSENATRRCPDDQLLPCFLTFTDYLLPRDDNSNMRCRAIIRKTLEQAQQDCAGDGPGRLGEGTGDVAERPTDRWLQRFELAPSYYQYQACSCLLGFSASWDESRTVLTCYPEQTNSAHKATIIAAAVASAIVLVVAFAVWRQYLRTRPRWLRERELQVKRSKGAPRAAKPGERTLVSIVVTDVKDFSELTRRYPELMNKAMGGHNNIMRKGCHAHAGYILDQEGDSWTIAFHDAEDAVAFSLQVQQALHQKTWNMRVAMHDPAAVQGRLPGSITRSKLSETNSAASSYDMMMGGERGGEHGSFSAASDGRGSSLGAPHSHGCSFTAAGGGAGAHGPLPPAGNVAGRQLPTPFAAAGNGGGEGARRSTKGAHAGAAAAGGDDVAAYPDTGAQPSPDPWMQGQHAEPPPPAGGRFSWLVSWGSTSSSRTHSLSMSSRVASAARLPPLGPPHAAAAGPLGGRSLAGGPGSMAQRQHSPGASRLAAAGSALMRRMSQFGRSNLGNGLLPTTYDPHELQELQLLVRIGVATGHLPYGCDVANCLVKDRAKAYISDVANGGQVLMDQRTFRAVKHSLSALGTVDESGYNDAALQALLQANAVDRLKRRVTCCRGSCVDARADSFSSAADTQPQDYDTDALVVHMGTFTAQVGAPPGGPDSDNDRERSGHDSGSSSSSQSGGEENVGEGGVPAALGAQGSATGRTAAAAATQAEARAARAARRKQHATAGGGAQARRQHLHMQLYSIAAPKMRVAGQTGDASVPLVGWHAPVRVKPGWSKVQGGYFDAPGARCYSLAPATHDAPRLHAPLPSITFVFAEVAGAAQLAHKRLRPELHAVNKSIRHAMLQLQRSLPHSDGYLCRYQEVDLRYIVAFESPARALQWCLLVQEALMYLDYPASLLELPGFEEVLDAGSGRPLFRGPRLRMGLSEGPPSSIMPDHMGLASYTGGAVNRAARFMSVAALPGQVVCDVDLARRCFALWPAHTAPVPRVTSSRRRSWGSATPGALASPLDDVPTPLPLSAGLQGLHAGAAAGEPDEHLLQVASRSLSETSGHCQPATGPRGYRSRAMQELWMAQQQAQQQQQLRALRQGRHHLQGAAAAPPPVPWAGSSQNPPLPLRGSSPAHSFSRRHGATADAQQQQWRGSGGPSRSSTQQPAEQEEEAAAAALEPLTASHIGTFSFKGLGAYEMVQVSYPVLAGRVFAAEAPRGKGLRLVAASGVVSDVPPAQLRVPASLLSARATHRDRRCSLSAREPLPEQQEQQG